jgi:hypothetical protein
VNDERDLSLLETLDHLLDRGVVIAGEAIISIGNVDLLYLGLNVVLSNVDSLMRDSAKRHRPAEPPGDPTV